MKKFFYLFGLAAVMTSCGGAKNDTYVVNATFDAVDNDLMAYIVNYDTGDKIDSAVVENGKATFTGKIESPVLARMLVTGGLRRGSFVLKADSITFAGGQATGGELNKVLNDYNEAINVFRTQISELPDSAGEEQWKPIMDKANAYSAKVFAENKDNVAGYFIFLNNFAYELDLKQLKDSVAKYPSLANYKRITDLQQALENKAATSEGAMFKDFEVNSGDSVFRLSDYVGKGDYVLVDFWASWCGPCMREIEVIRGIYEELSPKGLNVIGVAVWDEPENTKTAVESKNIPWQIVYDAQKIPTDIYGISGIPCIILFGPDGKILLRDKYDEELVSGVKAFFEDAK